MNDSTYSLSFFLGTQDKQSFPYPALGWGHVN